jgi:glycosyltransferase involved in cell wall biosynthesis
MMKVSVVVPAFNEEKLIEATLGSIKQASSAFASLGWERELIVCDNNSTDRTAEMARVAGARVVFEAVNQIGRARNAGAAQATGDWLVFVDADSRPTPELFADVAKAISSGECLAGGSTVRLEGPYPVAKFITGAWNILSRITRWAPGSFIFCQRVAFQKIGGFNEELFATEEIELFQRLKKLAKGQGKRIVILGRHPLLTSARKMDLYSPWEHLRFVGRIVLRSGKPLRSRDECFTWYDGRR